MTTTGIPIAKVTRPLLSGTVPRRRLFSLLDKGRAGAIVWVDGPPGCGKTTLVSGYIEARKLPCLWYDLDERDADPATFFHYLEAAVRKAAPRIRRPMPSLSPENLLDVPSFSRRYFEELFERLPPKAVVVLDNFHLVPDGSPFHGVILEGLSRLPTGTSAIVISRSGLPHALAGLRAARTLRFLDWNDLRLTLEESKAIVRKRWGKFPAPAVAQYLQKSADGWAAGLVLLLARMPAEETGMHSLRHETPYEIFEYFGEEIFQRQSPGIRNFLMQSALLPAMTGDATRRLTGLEGAGEVLSWLHRNNYFTGKHRGAEPIYRYHGLFRKFLLERAREAYPPEEMSRLYREAAGILAKSGHIEDAAALLHASGDQEGFRRLILGAAPDLLRQGRSHTLEEWILSLPEALRAEDPWLLYWAGACSFGKDFEESRAAFERAFDLFSRTGDVGGAFLSWSKVVNAILFQWNDFRPLDRWIDWLDRRIAEGAAFPSTEIEARVSTSMAGALLRRRPHHPDIRAWVDRALSASRATGDENLKLQSMVHVANYHHWTGDRAATSLALEEIRFLSRSPTVSPGHAVYGLSLEASTLLWAEADTAGALRIVTEGLDATRRLGVHPQWDHLFFAAGAYAALLAGDGKAAGEYLGKVKAALPPSRRFAECQYDHLCAWHHLFRGDPQGAAAHAKRALANAVSTGAVFPEILFRITSANIAEGRGEHEEAKALLLGIGDRIRSSGNRIFEFMERLTAARIAFGSGDESGGLLALREGMELGRKQGYVTLFWWWEPKTMARLCAVALEAGIEVPYVREMIRKNRLVPDPSAPDLEKWPWPVKVYTFGRFSLVVDGKVLPPARKTRQKPLLLLRALIALGGREVPEEQFTEIMWPDADGDLAHQSLAKTLERLREMLGDDRAVLLRDGRLTLNNRHCWVDVWELERKLGRADAARKPGTHAPDGGEVARLVERAFALYRGTFLSGETFSSNIVTLRERLRSKFLRAVVLAGRHWEQAGDWDKAIVCYQKGLEVDPLSEDMCRCLISCNMRMGRAAEAHAVYRRCSKTLSAVLGVSPSPDLRAMLTSAPTAPAPVRK